MHTSLSRNAASSFAKEIPDYATMVSQPSLSNTYMTCVPSQTPAERVRAKMKAMLDKATAPLSAAKEEEEGVSVHMPTPAQLEMIEAEGFEAAKFVSHRIASKVRLCVSGK